MLAVDQSIILREGSNGSLFVVFGDVVRWERFISWYFHSCNHVYHQICVSCSKGYQVFHMMLAKLEGGYAEQLANNFIWFVNGEAGPGEFDVSTVLHRLNIKLRRVNIGFYLHVVRLPPCLYKCNDVITGSSARDVLWKGRCELRERQVHLSDLISFWFKCRWIR